MPALEIFEDVEDLVDDRVDIQQLPVDPPFQDDCNTLVVKPQTYDPSCDLCSLALWTYDILYDCGIFLLPMINLIKDLLLMFDNMNLYVGTIININVITRISAIFECC